MSTRTNKLAYLLFFCILIIPNIWNVEGVISQRPHIIVVIADDLGYNDVGYRGSNQIPTPNIDALGYNGIILDKFYTLPTCTPSRAAFLTGNYPMRSGLQGTPIGAGEDRSLPRSMLIMPQQLKNLGYKTHLVGKWHLGAARKIDTPLEKGFDTHYGYWNGFCGYFNYMASSNKVPYRGFDLHDNFIPDWPSYGTYATDQFTKKSLEVIEKHNVSEPLFLMVSHLAAHTGDNGTELGVPDVNYTNAKYSYIQDERRRLYADVVNRLDQSVGHIVTKLQDKGMLQNSIVMFFSDNGAQTSGLYENFGSNWPLRGLKFTMFEGAVRGTGVIYSPLLEKKGYINRNLLHLVDFLPTFYAAAGGNVQDLGKIDGINQWLTLSKNETTKRKELLVHFDEALSNTAIITHGGRFKLVNGSFNDGFYEDYFGESGRGSEVPDYDVRSIFESPTNLAIQSLEGSIVLNESQIKSTRIALDLGERRNAAPFLRCDEELCLFDLDKDPCETTNLIDQYPDIANELMIKLHQFWTEYLPQTNKDVDPASDPALYNNTYTTWLDLRNNSGQASIFSTDFIGVLTLVIFIVCRYFNVELY